LLLKAVILLQRICNYLCDPLSVVLNIKLEYKLREPNLPALEPDDYYFNEEGLMVFTVKYHLKRGYCCQNGCKHCPYGFGKKRVK